LTPEGGSGTFTGSFGDACMKTTIADRNDIKRCWYLVDAADKPAGRLAAKIAHILRGKTKPLYTPHVDIGDFVVVVNAEKIKLTGAKEEKKMYKDFSGFPGGLKHKTAASVRAKNPTRIIMQAVEGMLPGNKSSRQIIKRLKVYAGAEHPHAAQQLQAIQL
jgi:large subunit ribosomal protein L13